MKEKMSNATQWILTAIISLLGFSGCSKEEEMVCMYGSPTVDYKAEGCVTDEGGNPIEGICVKVEIYDHLSGSEIKTVYSGEDGLFITPKYRNKKILSLTATDVDGNKNGGEFNEKKVDLQNMQPDKDKTNADGWYQGIRTYNVDIKLTKKSADNE